jgi:hypothetical protein
MQGFKLSMYIKRVLEAFYFKLEWLIDFQLMTNELEELKFESDRNNFRPNFRKLEIKTKKMLIESVYFVLELY